MQWICTSCGYIHRGDGPPDSCPNCGAPRSAFAEWDGEEKGDE